MFFSSKGTYQPCGMFSIGHIIALAIMIILVALAVFFTRNIKKDSIIIIIRSMAIVFTILEIIKIIFQLTHGLTEINNYVPLYFCSLFIYALWFASFKKTEKIGLAFIFGGAIIAGFVFLLFPSTSLVDYPLFHFVCFYSLIYHSSMMYLGIIIAKTHYYEPNIKDFNYYFGFVASGMIIAIIIDLLTGSNLMFIMNPGQIPVLKDIASFSTFIYSIMAVTGHMLMFPVSIGVYKLIQKINNKETILKSE